MAISSLPPRSNGSWCFPQAHHVEQIIHDILMMRAHARDKGYADNALLLLISQETFHQIKRFSNNDIYNGYQILKMDFYILSDRDVDSRRGRGLYADLLIKTRLAHYEDIPPANADQPIQPRRRVPEPRLMRWEF